MIEKSLVLTIKTAEYEFTRDSDGEWLKTHADYGGEYFKLLPSEIDLCEYFVKVIDELKLEFIRKVTDV